jgi:ketosteroid isomerase-like protein
MNPEEIVKKSFDRWNKRDVDGAAALLEFEVVVSNSFASQRKIGKEGVRKGMAALTKAFPDSNMEIAKIFAHGDTVALEEFETGTLRHPLDGACMNDYPRRPSD